MPLLLRCCLSETFALHFLHPVLPGKDRLSTDHRHVYGSIILMPEFAIRIGSDSRENDKVRIFGRLYRTHLSLI